VAPARAAQLNFASGGTVTTVYVHSGQQVHKDDPLAELQLSPDSLEAAQRQATLAQLTYESQAAKVKDLKGGASSGAVADAQAALARAQAAQHDAERKAGVASSASTAADQAVALAQLELDQAQRDVGAARQRHEQKLSDAGDKLGDAAAVVRQAQRGVADAQSRLDELVASQASARANRQQEVDRAQLELNQARADLQAAQANEQRVRRNSPAEMQRAVQLAQLDLQEAERALRQAQDTDERLQQEGPSAGRTRDAITKDLVQAGWAVQAAKNAVAARQIQLQSAQAGLQSTPEQAIAQAVDAVRAAQDRVDSATQKLQQAQAALEDASDAAQLAQARTALDQANDTLARAQAAEQRAQADRDALRPAPEASSAGSSADAASADASADSSGGSPAASANVEDDPAVAAAQARVRAATIKLQQARDAQQATLRDAGLERQSNADEVAVRRAETAAAQAHLDDLRAGSSPEAIDREQRLADLLRDEADQARLAAQPVVTLKAPFDGLVTAVAVSPGQSVEPHATVVRFAGNDGLTVIATASETEVSELSADEQVSVTFPNIPNLASTGTIVDIGGVGTIADGGKTTTYPVRVDLADTPSQLKIGMSAIVSLTLREARDVLHLPINTIRQSGGQNLVSRLDPNGQITEVPLQLGGTYGTEVEILGGLAEGDTVAIFRPAGTTAVAKQ
jgi:multidrug efflux pump subunit AcrA (membrane-fusion protein)